MTTSNTTGQPAGNFDWDTLTLAEGSHDNGETDDCGNPLLCFMEALNVSRGLRVTDDCPADVSRTLYGFIIEFNDALGTVDRQRLKPYRDQIGGTGGQPAADERAAYMCVDWLIRTHTPTFLRLADLTAHADALAGASEIIDLAALGQVTDHVSAARSAAESAADSAVDSAADSAADWAGRSAAYSTAYSTAASAGCSAAYSAAYSAAESAAVRQALLAAYLAADSVVRSAAVSVSVSAAVSAAEQMLTATAAALQASAFGVLDQMIATYTVAAA